MITNHTNNAFDVVVARLDVGPNDIRSAATVLSEDERNRADRFVFDRDRNRFMVARAKLRELLAERTGTQPKLINLKYGEHGKPALACEFSSLDLRFNLSHSEDIAVFAFSHGREIGVDVEAVRELADLDDVAAHCFSIRENAAYLGLDAHDKTDGFYNCWTRKEAFIKALGDGFYHPLDSFDVSLAPGEPARILRVGNTLGDSCGWQIYGFAPISGYVGAIAIESPTRQSSFIKCVPGSTTQRRRLHG